MKNGIFIALFCLIDFADQEQYIIDDSDFDDTINDDDDDAQEKN